MVSSICKEVEDRSSYLQEEVRTIYFGGGTPSLLTYLQIESILSSVHNHFSIAKNVEITLEANPEDLNVKKLGELRSVGINRLSIGIQTFNNEKLKWMNRAHSSDQATNAYLQARKAGFENISLDLIYARPDEDAGAWTNDLHKIVELNPEHISLYGLTIEDKTVFRKWEKEHKLIQLPEEDAASQYLEAITYLAANDFHQYEASNFSKAGFESKHNSAYWTGAHYLGVGPGAHSFNGEARHINIRNNAKYLKLIAAGETHYDVEVLSKVQRINEQTLTSLRTINGLDFNEMKSQWGVDLQEVHHTFIKDLCNQKMAVIEHGKMRLLPNGFLIADEISLRLFFPE